MTWMQLFTISSKSDYRCTFLLLASFVMYQDSYTNLFTTSVWDLLFKVDHSLGTQKESMYDKQGKTSFTDIDMTSLYFQKYSENLRLTYLSKVEFPLV
jgi:hypothetical protein